MSEPLDTHEKSIEIVKKPNTSSSALLIKKGTSQTIEALRNHRSLRQQSECKERDLKSPS